MSSTESLPLLLKQLRLHQVSAHWQDYANQANEQHWSYSDYLATLCNLEATQRQQDKIKRRLKQAKLPANKTIDSFDFDAAPSINAAQMQSLAHDTQWVHKAHNLIIFGPSGAGKTHLASAIAYQMIHKDIRCLFTSTMALVQSLQQAKQAYKLNEAIAKLARIPLLILDDIGYVRKDEAETSVLFELIADRYENNSLIITANQSFSEWGEIFPDHVMAVAAVDRLVHHATIINIDEDSYRTRNACQNNSTHS